MFDMKKTLHVVRLAAVLAAALAISACANKTGDDAQANAAGAATPGSQQDFVVNVGDRVFFETDSTELTPLARATLDKQAQWLTNYSQYSQFTIEGHADERGTR
jgi:peptidoglycan-associated lipoprotein